MQRKYVTIYQDLVDKIKSKQWQHTQMLPSEHELTNMYDASRETIRKALNLLMQNGYIQKVRGKGSVIIDMNRLDFPVSGIVSFNELAQNMDMDVATHVHEVALVKATEDLQAALQVNAGDMVWRTVRVREIAGEKIILDKDYFNTDIVSVLTKDIAADSIYTYLENELQLKIGYARKEITVEYPTEEDCQLLDMNEHTMIVVIKSVVFLEDARLFQYTESRHRPDKFRFVDFARRNLQ